MALVGEARRKRDLGERIIGFGQPLRRARDAEPSEVSPHAAPVGLSKASRQRYRMDPNRLSQVAQAPHPTRVVKQVPRLADLRDPPARVVPDPEPPFFRVPKVIER